MANPLLFFPLPSPLTRSRGKETVHLGSSTVLQRRDETLMIVSLMRANVNKGRGNFRLTSRFEAKATNELR